MITKYGKNYTKIKKIERNQITIKLAQQNNKPNINIFLLFVDS
mgnify:CR=1 FL=1